MIRVSLHYATKDSSLEMYDLKLPCQLNAIKLSWAGSRVRWLKAFNHLTWLAAQKFYWV
jgi:hypothetical protein